MSWHNGWYDKFDEHMMRHPNPWGLVGSIWPIVWVGECIAVEGVVMHRDDFRRNYARLDDIGLWVLNTTPYYGQLWELIARRPKDPPLRQSGAIAMWKPAKEKFVDNPYHHSNGWYLKDMREEQALLTAHKGRLARAANDNFIIEIGDLKPGDLKKVA